MHCDSEVMDGRHYKESSVQEKTNAAKMEISDVMERLRNSEPVFETKQVKTVAYTCVTILSFIALGVWIRDCARSLDHCSATGDKVAAILGGFCGAISLAMLILWQTSKSVAEKFCAISGHALFLLLVAGAIIGAESRSDTDLWLAIAALPALMLAVHSWQENRPQTPREIITIGEDTALMPLRQASGDFISD